MQRDVRKLLWDAREAADAIAGFVSGKSDEDYAQDLLLRSAVERQLTVVGEALGQLARSDPQTAAKIADLSRIVAFRNILIHGYAVVNDETEWRIVNENLPALRVTLAMLLHAAAPPPG
jgi:uncharacterized protein with HEPN domain